MESFLDIPYDSSSPHPRQALDLYLPSGANASSPLLVFIHGGAWRSESKADLRSSFIPSILALTNLPLAILEYRLAPAYPHPAQITDVLSGVHLLTSSSLLAPELKEEKQKWDRKKLYLVGHSAGAFMAASIVLSRPGDDGSGDFVVEKSIKDAVRGIVCVDGIYDLPSLIDEYPDYRGFVTEAFGKDEQRWARESPGRWSWPTTEKSTSTGSKPRVWVVHSKEDELLSLRQPEEFVAHLESQSEGSVEVNYETLRGGHDALLRRDELPKLIAEWIQG